MASNMADRVETLDEFEFGTFGAGRGVKKWDWDTMLDGAIHKVTLDQPGDSKPESFGINLRNAAQDRGLSVQVKVDSKAKTVYFRSHKGTEEEQAEIKAKAKKRHAGWVAAAKRRAAENGTPAKKNLADEFEGQNGTQEEEKKPVESKKARKRREAAEVAAKVMAE